MVPGVLPTPNPAANLEAQLPGLPTINQTASNDLQSQLGGTLSPGTLNALQNAAATYGTTSGMAGGVGGMAGLDWNSLYGNIAGASEAQQQQGLSNYGPLTTAVSSTQTLSPTLSTEIASQNALNAAAPNPTQAASYSQQLFNQYLNAMKGPGGGTIGSPAFNFSDPTATIPGTSVGMPGVAGGYGGGYSSASYSDGLGDINLDQYSSPV